MLNQKLLNQASAAIVNLSEQNWVLHRSFGTYRVRGCEGDEAYTLTRVDGRTAFIDMGDKRTTAIHISADELANDLCREINSDGGEESNFGVFVAEGDIPSQDELERGHEKLAAFYRRLVESADREWERSHSYLFINDVERRAAKYLGLEKDWFYQARETVECPGCGEKIKPGVAVCRTCRAILDPTKAANLGLVPAGHAGPRKNSGRRKTAVGAVPTI